MEGIRLNKFLSEAGICSRREADRLIEAGVDPETAERDACRMEHVISQESFEHLRDAYKTKNE